MDERIQPIEEHGLKSKQAIIAVREIIRRGVLTFEADSSPFARMGIGAPAYARQWKADMYADAEQRPLKFVPSAYDRDQAFQVLDWLKWLREFRGNEGPLAVRRIIRWCHDVPNTVQAQREGCSDDTILNRIDRDVAKIIGQFFSLGCTVQVIEAPYKATAFAMEWDQQRADQFGSEKPMIMNVYVHGRGIMRNGKVWDEEMTSRGRYPRRAS